MPAELTRMTVSARLLGVAILALSVTAPGLARGDEGSRQQCLDAAVTGQGLLKARKLIEARTVLGTCSRADCPGLVQRDCTQWLAEADQAIPSVVLSVRDAADRDLVDAHLLLDGQPLAADAEGKALPLDPGTHVLRIERAGAPTTDRTFVVREGEKSRPIAVRIEPVPIPEPARKRAPIPVATMVLGGAGLIAAGTFGYFSIRGLADRGQFGCAAGCSQAQHDQVIREFDGADVALGIAAASVAAAVWIYLARGTAPRAPAMAGEPGAGPSWLGGRF
jgi:hypothetical protein